MLRQILSKHTKHYKALLKQQEILINHQKNTKNLLKALSHGASGAVRPGAVGSVASGSGSGDDQSGRKHEEIEISSNSSGESVLVKYDGSNDVGRRIRFQMQNWTK